jgi:hypothetical protein
MGVQHMTITPWAHRSALLKSRVAPSLCVLIISPTSTLSLQVSRESRSWLLQSLLVICRVINKATFIQSLLSLLVHSNGVIYIWGSLDNVYFDENGLLNKY